MNKRTVRRFLIVLISGVVLTCASYAVVLETNTSYRACGSGALDELGAYQVKERGFPVAYYADGGGYSNPCEITAEEKSSVSKLEDESARAAGFIIDVIVWSSLAANAYWLVRQTKRKRRK